MYNFLSNIPSNLLSLFSSAPSQSGQPFVPDMSGLSTYADIGIDPASSAFDSNMGTYDPASQYYDIGGETKRMLPNFGNQMNQQLQQQLAQLNQSVEPMQMQRGKAVEQAILSSLLSPQTALKAYRPTLL
jgi:hypothetical protein